jgi:hypothetical protein
MLLSNMRDAIRRHESKCRISAAECALFVSLLTMASSAESRVTRLVIEQRQVYAGGHSWGAAGPYEHIVGRAYFEVDPADSHNTVIFNLDKAPRNARGLVEFSAPVFILKPVNAALGNGKIFYNVNNRGNSDVGFVPDASNVSRHVATQLKRGFSLVDAGWHGDGIPNARQLFPQFPVATRAERMVSGDPRLSLQERYHDHAGFVAEMKKASQQLARERYLLPEDADEWVAAAEQSDVLKSDAVKTGPPA